MNFLTVAEVARRFSTASVLQVDAELSSEPAHVTVVGRRGDERTRALLLAALSDAAAYKRVEAWDPSEGPLPNADVQFPELDKPAAFACSNGRCSLPAFDPAQLRDRVEKLRASSAKPPSG